MRIAWLLALAALSGCDKLFGLIHVDRVDADARMDGTVDVPSDTDRAIDAAGDVAGDLGCPASYTATIQSDPDSLFRFVLTQRTWLAAHTDCVDDSLASSSKHTHLGVISSDQERSAYYFGLAGSAGAIWIGLSDRKTEGSFLWVTGEDTSGYPPLSAWEGGMPGGDGNCVMIRASSTQLDDVNCDTGSSNGLPVGYVCECDASPNDSNRY